MDSYIFLFQVYYVHNILHPSSVILHPPLYTCFTPILCLVLLQKLLKTLSTATYTHILNPRLVKNRCCLSLPLSLLQFLPLGVDLSPKRHFSISTAPVTLPGSRQEHGLRTSIAHNRLFPQLYYGIDV